MGPKAKAKPGAKRAAEKVPFKPLPVPPVESLVGSKNLLEGEHARGKFYITTAINYANGAPHIGHAYEALTTDVIARFHRLCGKRTYFLTGADEHGQKVALEAEKQGLSPQKWCDTNVQQFRELNKSMCISNDGYIRTTDQFHQDQCRLLWERCDAAGDIYLDSYVGWYNTKEECFVTDADAELDGFKDPTSNTPYTRMEENTYFFRLSKYQDQLLKHIDENPEFIQPDSARQAILEFLKEPLRDLCVSRTKFSWGVKVPTSCRKDDKEHVMYVWFDALTNYLSETRWLQDPKNPLADLWPADCHLIGKDISRFHCVYWPCMLWSAKIELPKKVFSHGHVLDQAGAKMSKSVGNVVDPVAVLKVFPADSFRFYLCNEGNFGSDLKFNVKSLVQMHNSCLADDLGNLANRAVMLLTKFCDGKVPKPKTLDPPVPLPFDIGETRKKMVEAVDKYDIKGACQAAREASSASNKWITEQEPWAKKGEPERQAEIIRLALEAVYALALFFAPFHPIASTAIIKKFNTPPRVLPDIRAALDNLEPGTPIQVGPWENCGETLFPKLDDEMVLAALPAPAPVAAAAAAPEPASKWVKTPAPPLPAAPTYDPKNPQRVDSNDQSFRFQTL